MKIMWHSEADIYKDLMSLDDSGNDETYKVLYSRGRGFKNHQEPKPMNSFVDCRTGEVINLNEISEPSDICHKSRGRGNALSHFLKSGNQLQKQLRLARPLGSGDNAIEAFCRRNFPTKSKESASDSESDAGKPGISSDITHSPFGSLIDNMKQKVKATRNSKLQQNALINSLISKATYKSDLGSTVMNPNLENADDSVDDADADDEDDADADEDDDDDDDDDGGHGDKSDSSIISLSRSFDFDCSSVKSTESNIETSGSELNVKIGGLNIQEKSEEFCPRISANFCSPNTKECILDEKSQWLGKRLNKEGEDLYGSTSKNFTVNSDDFPPLKKNNLS